MPADHLDDDALIDAMDGVDLAAPAAGHLASCAACQDRLTLLRNASRLVATPVPRLDPAVVDALVEYATSAPVVPLAERRRLLRTVPPPWVVAVAAAAALVLGVPALLRSTTGGDDQASISAGRSTAEESVEGGSAAGSAGGRSVAVADESAPAVGDHLGAFDSDQALIDGLRTRLAAPRAEASSAPVVASPTAGRAAGSANFDSVERDEAAPKETGPPAPTCGDKAKAAAGQDAGAVVYLAPVTWKGEQALVYVYALAQPDQDGAQRQAVVTTLSGCDVVAALRF